MRGSASYSYPTHSKQMNHAPKWPTEFRRHVASAHANRSAYTRARARHTHVRRLSRRVVRAGTPGHAKRGLEGAFTVHAKEFRTKQTGTVTAQNKRQPSCKKGGGARFFRPRVYTALLMEPTIFFSFGSIDLKINFSCFFDRQA